VAVANAIEVRLPGSAERTDGEIASASVQVLESDAVLDVKDLDVNVSKGWVTLGGEVEWAFQKEDAERLVRRLWGVVGVTNMIAVRARPTPLELKHRIEEALVRSAETDARRIEVELKDGKVVLKGTVRSWAEREEAERTAWLAPGITHVVNQIELAY
jgi:osmotically-inducible protein OsmY